MDTIIKTAGQKEDEEIYKIASEILHRGGLVAFPTETVYGLGADALNENAAKKIYAAKGRPSDNPLIVHIGDFQAVEHLAAEISENARRLMEAFWPGPMTLVMKKKPLVPSGVTGGLDTVAIRMPSHPTAQKLIRASGLFIAAPSANLSGRPSPTRAAHVIQDLDGKIDMIIRDDTVSVGIESTIIDVSTDCIQVLRPGWITLDMIRAVTGTAELDPAIAGERELVGQPKAPGMKYKHYAPRAALKIVEGSVPAVTAYINEEADRLLLEGKKVGIMATDETASAYRTGIVRSLGSRKDEESIARHLYACLREYDDLGAEVIFSESFSGEKAGQAIMNRLMKAAGHCIIKL